MDNCPLPHEYLTIAKLRGPMLRKIAIFLVAAGLPAFGDFSYQQTSKVTGGMMAGMMKFAGAFSKQAREPMASTVAVKGNRMVHGSEHRASVIDLDKETITEINFDKKEYSVRTFQQMKEAMEAMSQRMRTSDAQKADVKYKVSVKDTGAKKQIAGFDTHEAVVTMEMEGADQQTGNTGGMTMTSDMWLAPKMAGFSEVTDFYKRMGEKVGWAPTGLGAMGARPEMMKGFAELYKEGSKLNGMPVLQTVVMGTHGEGQAAAPQEQQQAEKPTIASVLGRKKKADDADSTGQQGSESGSLMEMTMELSGFSAAPVDGAKFEVPAGFKQVEPDAGRRRR